MSKPSFVLLTACKNEAKYIETCIRSVIKQTQRPVAWVIVDDGSSDETASIVERCGRETDFIKLLRLEPRKGRSFGAQYRAIKRGLEFLKDTPFDFLGVMDADIELESDRYYEQLFSEFSRNARLGIAGGVICERDANQKFVEREFNASWSVAGAVQMFRRELYEEQGGYVPLEYGGSDTLAEVSARQKGWDTRSIGGLRALHYRPTSTADGRLRGIFRLGMLDGSFGSHPLFMMLKCVRRIPIPPFLIGGIVFFAGYGYCRWVRRECVVPREVMAYLRREQMGRVKALLGIGNGAVPSANKG
jgi:glycosyltransferase involved in cell wall biosynthesis